MVAIAPSWWWNDILPTVIPGGAVVGGRGGMVDATDLKSVDLNGREGSSPSAPIVFCHRFQAHQSSCCGYSSDLYGLPLYGLPVGADGVKQ